MARMMPEPSEPDGGTYLLEQSFRYTYADSVRQLRHRLVVVPRAEHGCQRRLDHGLTVSGSAAVASVSPDDFGNHVVEVEAPVVAEWIEFRTWALVRRGQPDVPISLPPVARADRRLLAATPLTRAEGALTSVAQELSAAADGDLDLAERACAWSHQALRYQHGVTDVRTTAAGALAAGAGVCQDYAHLMLAVCRAAGLPARYVSGHLVGEGGSHAWVEVVVAHPSAGRKRRAMAIAFDPTHDRRAGPDYITVAVGRDYNDVAPTSGTFEGAGQSLMSARKRLRLAG